MDEFQVGEMWDSECAKETSFIVKLLLANGDSILSGLVGQTCRMTKAGSKTTTAHSLE